jgi:twitching motility protein PilT
MGKLITYDEALRQASNPDEFRLRVEGIRSSADSAKEEMEKTAFERLGR